jgi:FKBP-type peptidyl-prolyl cis-trans isomerase
MEKLRGEQQAKMKAEAEKNQKEGDAFLAKNKAKKGVKVTASGLQYEVVKEGSGAKPVKTDTVTVNYVGTKIDGTEFDSSIKRGQPAEFPLNGVIPCWTEGVQRMKVGEKARLVCPASIAYGERGRPGIPGGATLVFEVELLGIGPAK